MKWRFSFNPSKTKCFISGKHRFCTEPRWYIGEHRIEVVNELDILGTVFDRDGSGSGHAERRINSCRRNFFGLGDIGMVYPGLDTNTKCYLWNTMCAPTLLYGAECIKISDPSMRRMESIQGCLIKQCLGLGKRHRHSNLLKALDIKTIESLVAQRSRSLYSRIFNIDSPARDLNLFFLESYITTGKTFPGTLCHNIVKQGSSPVALALGLKPNRAKHHTDENGIVDSLRFLVFHENFIKPYKEEHLLVSLLTRAF